MAVTASTALMDCVEVADAIGVGSNWHSLSMAECAQSAAVAEQTCYAPPVLG